jgi:hypothetical protein
LEKNNTKMGIYPQNATNKPCECGGNKESGGCSCNSEGENKMTSTAKPSYVYAIGKVVPRFPNKSLE